MEAVSLPEPGLFNGTGLFFGLSSAVSSFLALASGLASLLAVFLTAAVLGFAAGAAGFLGATALPVILILAYSISASSISLVIRRPSLFLLRIIII